MEEAFSLTREVIISLQQLLSEELEYTRWPALDQGDKFKLVNTATNFVVATDERCQQFLREEKKLSSLVPIVKSHPDWYKKEDVKAQIILSVKNTLRRKGIKTELQEILDEIMEQAEARYKEWDYRVA